MQKGQHVVIVIIYVDDLIILASCMSSLMALKAMLDNEYEMSDLGELHFPLGVEFVQVSVVSHHMARPRSSHWIAVKRIMRYFKGTSDIKLCPGGDNIELSDYCDTDYAKDTNDRRSTTGYMFKVGSRAMMADVLTNALARDRHQRLLVAFGLQSFGYSQSGSVGVG